MNLFARVSRLSLQQHLFLALGFGLVARLLSLWFVWGPQALDDYLDNLIPAWRHMMGQDPDLHNYRSPLYMWILSLWLQLGSLFSIENAISQIRWVYFFQASVSLLAIYGVYLLVKNQKEKGIALIAIWLSSLHGIMPFASTRSFMESLAMGLVTISVAYLYLANEHSAHTNWKKLFLGIVILGLTSLIRFQVGIIYVGWMGIALINKRYRQFLLGFAFGLCLVVMEALIDVGFGRYAFQTLYDYFAFNSNQQEAGVMPWYNTWLSWLGFLYFPFTFLLNRGWGKAIRQYKEVFGLIFLYVLAHSINPHKEERYLYPILPLSFIFMAMAWFYSSQNKFIKYLYTSIFFLINIPVLLVACFVNTQVGLIGPFAQMQAKSNQVLYLDYDKIDMRNFMLPFFVRPPAAHKLMENSPKADEIDFYFEQYPELKSILVLAIEEAEELKVAHAEIRQKRKCSELLFADSLSDRVMVKLAPKKNQRRRPTTYFYCHR